MRAQDLKRYIGYHVAALCLIVMMGPYALCSEMITLHIAEHTEVNAEEVRLGDIAVMTGGTEKSVAALQRVALGKAPQPGNFRILDGDDIMLRLKQSGISPAQVMLDAPDRFTIGRGSVEIPQEKIEEVVRDYIIQNMPWERTQARITGVEVKEAVCLPKGRISYEVLPPEGTEYQGTVLLPITFSVDGSPARKVWAQAYVEVLTDMVITTKPLGRQCIITEEDIRVERRDMSTVPSGAITSPEDAIGKRTRRMVSSNAALTSDLIEVPPVLKRGDLVTIIIDSDRLRVTARGEAQQRGRQGEVIRVKNLSSQKDIYGRVVDASTVMVEF